MEPITEKKTRIKKTFVPLKPCFNENTAFEIGIDEAGRGPLFGRVYVAAVILPKELDLFHHEWMRDSKQIKSPGKMHELAEYIKQNAISWSITYAEADEIDSQNILKCVIRCMHKCCIIVLQINVFLATIGALQIFKKQQYIND